MTDRDSSERLAAGFPPATRDEWRKLVDGVLKGAPFARLESRTYDGLTVEPLYARKPSARAIDGRAAGAAWTLMQRVDHPDPAAANAQALDDLNNGATGLMLVFAGSQSADGFGLDPSPRALARTLDGVPLERTTIELDLSAQSRQVVGDLSELIRSRGLVPAAVDLRAGFNALGAFAATGRAPAPWSEVAPHLAGAIARVADAGFRGPYLVADGRVIHDAGGSEAQELAFALASAVAYLRALETGGMTLAAARDAIYFRLAADADQVLTTAKFRAARKLWARVQTACGLAPKPATVTAETAWRMMTRRDAHVNMLRTTIAVAAAGFGGADAITVLPHTAALGLPDAFARRIARNTQLILLEESNLARVADPAAGSGALEAMTDQLCRAAWSMFQQTEKLGGAWAALQAGKIQEEVAAVCAERRKAVACRKDVLTGTNEFPNIDESRPTVLDVAPAAPAAEAAASVTTAALPRIRLAEPFELLRDASDACLARTGTRPKVFLACLGPQAEFTPRATFAKNVFETGGIEGASGAGDTSALGAAFTASRAMLACLCASDKSYDSDAAAAIAALKAAGARHIYLAGRPGPRETALRDAGVDTFIHEGRDTLATLRTAYDILGIKEEASK